MLYEKESQDDRCGFNYGIICLDHSKCEKCGWNPTVSDARREKLREEKK